MTFEEFILSMASGAYVQLGLVEDPFTNSRSVDLEQAKVSIELLEMLKQKTLNNLTQNEAEFLDEVIYDLKMKYAYEKAKQEKP